jgi:hypothetical protein
VSLYCAVFCGITERYYAAAERGTPTACVGWEMTIMAAIVIEAPVFAEGSATYKEYLGSIFVNMISNLIN